MRFCELEAAFFEHPCFHSRKVDFRQSRERASQPRLGASEVLLTLRHSMKILSFLSMKKQFPQM